LPFVVSKKFCDNIAPTKAVIITNLTTFEEGADYIDESALNALERLVKVEQLSSKSLYFSYFSKDKLIYVASLADS
jgi:hypothetical protein